MKTTTIFALLLCSATCFANDYINQEFVAAVYRGNSTHVLAGNSAVGAGGTIVQAGNTFLTPEGAYIKAGDSFLKPGGGAVVRAGVSYVGPDSAAARVNSGRNLIVVGPDGASIAAGNTILRPLLFPH